MLWINRSCLCRSGDNLAEFLAKAATTSPTKSPPAASTSGPGSGARGATTCRCAWRTRRGSRRRWWRSPIQNKASKTGWCQEGAAGNRQFFLALFYGNRCRSTSAWKWSRLSSSFANLWRIRSLSGNPESANLRNFQIWRTLPICLAEPENCTRDLSQDAPRKKMQKVKVLSMQFSLFYVLVCKQKILDDVLGGHTLQCRVGMGY